MGSREGQYYYCAWHTHSPCLPKSINGEWLAKCAPPATPQRVCMLHTNFHLLLLARRRRREGPECDLFFLKSVFHSVFITLCGCSLPSSRVVLLRQQFCSNQDDRRQKHCRQFGSDLALERSLSASSFLHRLEFNC